MKKLAEEFYTRNGRDIAIDDGHVAYNLGAGNKRYEGVIGIDLFKGKAVDIVHDINVMPWPVEADTADVVMGFQAFEHFYDLNAVMREVYRISKHGARLIVEVPYFRHVGAYQDPTHVHFFTSNTMAYFHETPKRPRGAYADDFHFRSIDFWYGWPAKSKNPIIQWYKEFIRKYHRWYDGSLLSILFPPAIIIFELEIIKEEQN